MTNRQKIIEVATNFFATKGYEATSVNQIIAEVGIAKGTFYHYFNSKEDVMKEVIALIIDDLVDKIKVILADENLSGYEKFKRVTVVANLYESTSIDNRRIIEDIHGLRNTLFHQLSIVESIKAVAPLIAKSIEQANEEGYFNCTFPLETVEFLIVFSNGIIAEPEFVWSDEELAQKMRAFVDCGEKLLGAPAGSLNFVVEKEKLTIE